MTRILIAVVACVILLDYLAWLALVPATVGASTFLALNALGFGMFATGLASAATGLPTPSVAQLLYDVEHPRAAGHKA
jgi:hypothetical protein